MSQNDNKQTNKQILWSISRRNISSLSNSRQTDRQRDRQTDRQTEKQKEFTLQWNCCDHCEFVTPVTERQQTNKQTNPVVDKQEKHPPFQIPDRQANRQTDRQTDGEAERIHFALKLLKPL